MPKTIKTPWYDKTVDALQLAGMSERTQQCYARAVRMLVEHFENWHLFNMLKAQPEKRLPCVLSRKEVFRILRHVRTFHNYAFLSTVYSCGLRLQEALFLQVFDIDKDRMLIHVHRGKGAKDRFVPFFPGTCLVCSANTGKPTATRGCSFRPWAGVTTEPPYPTIGS